MTTDPVLIETLNALAPHDEFYWRTGQGEFIRPVDMETRHLFHTVRMVWNHTAPKDAKLMPYIRHTFSSFYTGAYMKEAVFHLCRELFKRQDLKLEWRIDLDCMQSHFLKKYPIPERLTESA